MRDLFDQMTLSASGRYLSFLDSIRTQTEIAMHQGPISETVRNEAISAGQEVARSYLSVEQAYINEDTMSVARHAHASALSDLGAIPSVISDRFADFIFSASYYTTRMIAAQVERDVMAMAQYL